jgi:hypothetical protein
VLANLARADSVVKRMVPFRVEESLDRYQSRRRIRRFTYNFAREMGLSGKQHCVVVHTIIGILEAPYRPARRDLFDGINDRPVQFHPTNREKCKKDELPYDVEEK